MSSFDKKVCINNIYALAKEKDIKIGDIEKAGGLSAGYLSRLKQEENNSIPSIDFIASAAEQLGISVDSLISHDFTRPTPTEAYIFSFIEKLISDTMADKLYWVKDTALSLNAMDVDAYQQPNHPLFYIDWENGDSEPTYWSRFGENRVINDDCFSLKMSNDEFLYLMCATDSDGFRIYELYLLQRGTVNKLCQSSDAARVFNHSLSTLYNAADYSCQHPKLDPEVMDAINRFMTNTPGESDGDDNLLPF